MWIKGTQSIVSKILYKILLKGKTLPAKRVEPDYAEERQKSEARMSRFKISKRCKISRCKLQHATIEFMNVEGALEEPLLLYIHGGGFSMGSVAESRKYLSWFALSAGMNAASCEYRLAPEHPFPAALEDVAEVYTYLLKSGYQADKIVLMGESAGGELCLALALWLKDNNMPLPRGIYLMCPVTNLSITGGSRAALHKKDPIIYKDINEEIMATYAPREKPANPYLTPVYGDISGFPPLLLQVGEFDPLLDDSLQFYEKAKEANIDAKISVWPKMWHVFQVMWVMKEARKARDEGIRFIRNLIT